MITIILEDKDDQILAQISQEGNESYLAWEVDDPHYELLSQSDLYSDTCFAQADMPQLIQELQRLQSTLDSRAAEHITEVIALANRCLNESNTILTFTPFDEQGA